MTEQIVAEPVTAERRPEVEAREDHRYDPVRAQQRWQEFWAADQTFVPVDDGSKQRRASAVTPTAISPSGIGAMGSNAARHFHSCCFRGYALPLVASRIAARRPSLARRSCDVSSWTRSSYPACG